MSEDDVFDLLRSLISSVWELEILLLLAKMPERSWSLVEIDRELRASDTIVRRAAQALGAHGLLSTSDAGLIRFSPASAHLDEFVGQLNSIYATKPIAVINAIATASHERLKRFSDAFRFRD